VLSTSFSGGTLSVFGDDFGLTNDTIVLREKPGNTSLTQVMLNGVIQFEGSSSSLSQVKIFAGGGNDTITIGNGNLDFLPYAVSVDGQGGTDKVTVNDQTAPYSDAYTITGTTVSRIYFGGLTYGGIEGLTLTAEAGNNSITINSTAWGVPVTVNAGLGNDTVTVGNGNLDLLPGAVIVNGQGGTDKVTVNDQTAPYSDAYTITGTTVSRIYFGGLTYSGIEGLLLTAETGNNSITILTSALDIPVAVYGDAGNDSILGGTGNDTIYGGEGDDQLFGGDGNDVLNGGGGNDFLDGGEGSDQLSGGAGNDTIDGDNGVDRLVESGAGFWLSNTSLSGTTTGSDVLYSIEQASLTGSGYDDIIDASRFTAGPVTLVGGAGNDQLYGGWGNDQLYGGWGNDYLSGGAGNDVLYGEGGNDFLEGDVGQDTLYGGAGQDDLDGGYDLTADFLWGGTSADNFCLEDEGLDQAEDYNPSQGDVIDCIGPLPI
jgi:Ca2+-binding RTX toxin-like protein